MKKLTLTLVLSLFLAAAMGLTAAAETVPNTFGYDGIAKELQSLSIFVGDGSSFNLDDTPDRYQAAVMVVRMSGNEDAAKAAYEAGEIACPFVDVEDEWVKPYIAWMYEKGLTLGVGDGKFGNGPCTAQMYVTYMLRSLGYIDQPAEGETADFTFENALSYAVEKNLYDEILASESAFTRGVMAAVTYQTLAADCKGTENSLLEILTIADSVDAAAAEKIMTKHNAIDAVEAATAGMGMQSADSVKMSADIAFEMNQSSADASNVTTSTGVAVTAAAAFDISETKIEAAVDANMTINDNGMQLTLPMGVWIHENDLYLNLYTDKIKVPLSDMLGELELFTEGTDVPVDAETAATVTVSAVPYYILSGITIDENETGTIAITLDMTDFFAPAIRALFVSGFELPAEAETDLSVLCTISVNPDQTLAGMDAAVESSTYIAEADDDSYTILNSAKLTITNVVYGDAVTLEFPDFSEYVESAEDTTEGDASAVEESTDDIEIA